MKEQYDRYPITHFKNNMIFNLIFLTIPHLTCYTSMNKKMDADLKEPLRWLDFTTEESYLLETEGFTDFEDFVSTTKDDLKSMIDGFYKQNDLAFTIPIKQQKLLYDILEWCSDFDCRDMEEGIN